MIIPPLRYQSQRHFRPSNFLWHSHENTVNHVNRDTRQRAGGFFSGLWRSNEIIHQALFVKVNNRGGGGGAAEHLKKIRLMWKGKPKQGFFINHTSCFIVFMYWLCTYPPNGKVYNLNSLASIALCATPLAPPLFMIDRQLIKLEVSFFQASVMAGHLLVMVGGSQISHVPNQPTKPQQVYSTVRSLLLTDSNTTEGVSPHYTLYSESKHVFCFCLILFCSQACFLALNSSWDCLILFFLCKILSVCVCVRVHFSKHKRMFNSIHHPNCAKIMHARLTRMRIRLGAKQMYQAFYSFVFLFPPQLRVTMSFHGELPFSPRGSKWSIKKPMRDPLMPLQKTGL